MLVLWSWEKGPWPERSPTLIAALELDSSLKFLLDSAVVAHDCSSPCWRVWDGGKKHQLRLSLFLKHQIRVFPSPCFPAFRGHCRQCSWAATCSLSGVLTDVKEGACAGLSCLVWPIIADQSRLSPSCSSLIAARWGQRADLWAIDYPERQWPYNQLCEVDKDTWEENPFYFTFFSCSNLRREFQGHFS